FTDPSVVKRPNEAMIADYLLMGFRDPEATFFDGIKQLRPAHFLCVRDQSLHTERYWDVDPARQIRYARDEDYLDEFRELFREAVRCRLRSYAPVGVLLSGGLDSTSVTAMAETLRREDGGAPGLAAFTWLAEGFLQEEWDAVQHLVGSYKTETHLVRQEVTNGPVTLFEFFLDCAETPHHDGFLTIPLLLESAAARGCRVLLTGFGADELSQYGEEGFLADLLRTFRLRRLVREVQQRATAYGGGDWRGTIFGLLWTQLPSHVRRPINTLLRRHMPRWFEAEFAKRIKLDRWMMPEERRAFPTSCQEKPFRALTRPAMPLGLNQIDAMASLFSLECRHPYLDRRVIEFFLSIPSTVKMRAGYRKQFVQRATAGIVPGPIREREGLDYFIPAMDPEACRQLEAQRMERSLFYPRARSFRYVKRSEAERMRDHYLHHQAPYRNLLWSFVRLESWLQHWFSESISSEGGAL
ncbi:MAG: asparagine synthetase B family protein, partial [Acidobacteriota bacterium]